MSTPKITKCLFPAAGYGTRFLPATKAMPKEMLPVVNKPLIHYGVEEAISAGMDDIGIVYGRYKKAIPDYFDSHLPLEIEIKNTSKWKYLEEINNIVDTAQFSYTRQSNALGLGHAILMGKSLIGEQHFGVILSDDLCINTKGKGVMQQMSEVFAEQNADCVIAVQEVDKDQVDKYGIVETTKIDNKTFSITNMVEKPKVEEAKSNLAVVGRYILSPKIFPILKKLFEEKKSTGDSAELQITTALNTMVHTGHKVIAYKFDGKRFDCGSVDGMMEANSFVYKENLYIK